MVGGAADGSRRRAAGGGAEDRAVEAETRRREWGLRSRMWSSLHSQQSVSAFHEIQPLSLGAKKNTCFGRMDFGPLSAQDCFMGSVHWIEDSFHFQEFQNLDENQSLEPHPFVDSVNNLASSSSSSFSCCGSLPQEIMQSLLSEMQKQNVEIDWFLQQQSNRLRRAVLQEETRQRAVTMQKCESRMKSLMLQKDEELAIARNRATELQHLLKAAEMEAVAWERAAREKEATAAELSRRLNQVRERGDDAASFCGSSSTSGERKMDCKVCHAGVCSVVFFPCRHICCCRSCEPLLEHCPVCQTVKDARLQAFFFLV